MHSPIEVTASETGNSTLASEPTVNVDPGAILRAILMNAGDWSTPKTSYPARFSARAQRPLPHPRSVTSPLRTPLPLSRRSSPGAAPSAYSLKPASWMYARSAPYLVARLTEQLRQVLLPHRGQRVRPVPPRLRADRQQHEAPVLHALDFPLRDPQLRRIDEIVRRVDVHPPRLDLLQARRRIVVA